MRLYEFYNDQLHENYQQLSQCLGMIVAIKMKYISEIVRILFIIHMFCLE